MAKRSPRLIFTEEERALPELERAVRKADRAAVKLEKAEAKIPKKTVKVKKRVVDSESGKVTTRLFFEEADKKRPPSRLAHAARKAPLDTVRSAVHRKLREEGDDNPGTEAANTLTETAERTWRIAESAHRSHAEKPYRRADKAEAAADKANLKALNKQYEQEYGRASNPYSRWRQKQAIKKEYAAAKAGNGARNTVKASETTAKAAKRAAEGSKKVGSFFVRHKKGFLIAGGVAAAILLLMTCNGRFPTLLALISLFFLGGSRGAGRTLLATGLFLLVILFSVAMTLLASRLLSSTVLRGEPSAFSLELPPYRMPQIGRVLVRSLLDRTLFVLGRAVTVAAPMGLLIWVLANVRAGGVPVLTLAAGWLDPLGRLMGLDGMILLAFVLGFPANEIVLPILLMGYLQAGSLTACAGLGELQTVFTVNGWTARTAVCMVLLCLMHFPCGTTVLTIRRETGSLRWTAVGFLLPLGMGAVLCILANFLMGLTG